jgi:gamma-glutamyl:cysteine ligase YbdK (ATP-grasp superfamily)
MWTQSTVRRQVSKVVEGILNGVQEAAASGWQRFSQRLEEIVREQHQRRHTMRKIAGRATAPRRIARGGGEVSAHCFSKVNS